MKIVYPFLFLLFATQIATAQTDERKGQILIETEYNTFGGLLGGGSGISLVSSGGSSLTSIGVDGGYFVSKDLALLLRFSLLSADGTSLTTIGSGIKYYLIGSIPISAEFGLLSGGGGSLFTYGINAGYAIRLADNIALEPFAGVAFIEGSSSFQGGIRFALFL